MDLGDDSVRAYSNINVASMDFTKVHLVGQVEWIDTEIELVSDA